MTETTTTPALELAAALFALAEHLVEHPHLASGNVSRPVPSYCPVHVQIAGHKHLGEPDDMPALLAWAKSLDGCRIWIKEHDGEETSVFVEGVTGGVTIQVWDVDQGDLYRWRGTERETPITLDQLTAYVAAGTVEHADEIVAPQQSGLTPELLDEAKYWADNPLPARGHDVEAETR